MRLYGVRQPFFSPDGDAGTGGEGTGGDGGVVKDAAYWEGEARKAFADRDKAKRAIKALEESGRVVSDDQLAKFRELEAEAAKAEEERAKKAGEFDALRQNLVKKYDAELQERDAKLSTLSTRFKDTVVHAEFGKATDYFGGETAKTILDVELAIAALGRYVTVEDDQESPLGYRVVVKDRSDNIILGKDGKPAPFVDAIGELITTLPNKDRILRGSGKTGSGSSGGSSHVQGERGAVNIAVPIHRDSLTDPNVRRQVHSQLAKAGGQQMGRAWDRSQK